MFGSDDHAAGNRVQRSLQRRDRGRGHGMRGLAKRIEPQTLTGTGLEVPQRRRRYRARRGSGNGGVIEVNQKVAPVR